MKNSLTPKSCLSQETKMDKKWNVGSGPTKNNERLVNDEDTKLAVKSNKFKFTSLDECLNNSYTIITYLKGQQNKN